MPDVFDQIGGGGIATMPPAAPQAMPQMAPKGDVFDRISHPAAPAGDVFDQIAHPSVQAPVDHTAGNYLRAHPGMDPYAVQQAFLALQGKGQLQQAETPGEFSQQVANQQGEFTHFGNALGQTVANPIQGAVGLISPQTGMHLREDNALQYGPQTGSGGFVGNQAGNLVNAPMAMSGAGRILSAAEAMGNKRIDIAQERAGGQNVSGLDEIARVSGTGALDLGVNTLGNKIGGKLFGTVGKAGAGEAAPVVKQIIQQFAKQFGKDAVTNEVLGHAQIAAQNLMDGRPVTEGMGKESLVAPLVQTAAFAVAHGGKNVLERMRAKQSAAQSAPNLEAGKGQPQPAQPAQAGVEQTVDRAGQGEPIAHPAENRLPGAAPEAGPKAQPDNQTPAVEAARPAGGETALERPTPAAAAPRAEEVAHVEGHPQRLNDVDALTDWYAKQNPNDQTGDLIKTMAPHTPYVQAEVPVEHVKPLSDGQDVDRGKIDAMKAMTPEQRRALGPAIVGPDGEVFDGNHRAIAAQEAGDTHLKAFVPEDAVGTNGIKAIEAGEQKEQTPIQQLLNKGRESAEGKPQFGSDEWAASMQRATEAFKQRGRRGSARPGFITIPDSKFAERDVKPAAVELASAAKKSLGAINRFFGTGASWSTGDRDSANRISAALSEHDRAMAQAEHTLAPHREAMENWSDKAKSQWVDQVEATGHSPDPKLQAAADFNNTLNEDNIKEGKLYGLNTKKWEGDYIGRLAEFPDDKQAGTGGAGRTTMAGAQNFLKGRVFDTFSEFKKFVEDHGGKLKYDNPMDMLLAKQTEIQRSIMARKAMYTEDNRGQLKWVPDSEKPPEGFDRALRDPLAKQERRQILPSQMVARIAQMDHYAAKQFLEGPEVQKSAQYLRPGTDLPKGYSYSGESQTGTYHGNANVADQFNNLISSGLKKDVPILHQAAAIVKGTTSMALNLSGVHYAIESIRNASLSASRAVEAAVGGDFPLAAKNLKLMNPLAANKLGAQYREQYADPSAHPQLESQVKGAVEGGAPFHLKSVLDKNHFEDMKTEWKEGNKVGAGLRLVKGVSEAMHGPLFNHFVPNLKAAAAGMAAAQAESKGLTGLQKQRYMSLAHDNIENNLGMVARNRQFQNRIVTDVQDLVMLAPKFAEGTVRTAAAAVRDTATALKDVAQGKKAEMTPAMYTAVAHLVAHATLSSLAQIAYTTATTGKPIFPSSLMDLLKPRTGRKDDQGRDERLTMPTPVALAYGLITGGSKAITSRVAPIWHTLANEKANVDENNVEIRHSGDSFLKQLRDSAAYAVKGSMPFSVQNIQQGNRPGQPHGIDKSIGEAIGVHTSYVPSSKAEQEARSALFERGRANPMTQTQYERQQERGRIGEEFTGKNPQASKDLADDLKSGKLAQSDRVALMKQRKAPEGLTGELKKMQAEQIMDRVWPKMTAEEKQKNQWLVRGMVGRSTTLTGAQKQELWAKIKSETAGAK